MTPIARTHRTRLIGDRGATRRRAWPTAAELDLLRAALLADGRAVAAWQRWSSERPTRTERRLLPLVAWNLRRLGTSAALFALAERELASSWSWHRALDELIAPILRDLQLAGIRPLLLKGLPLAHQAFPLPALRPPGDVDLLVGSERLDYCRGLFAAVGWRPALELPPTASAHLHSFGYVRGDGLEVDLHGHALLECCYAGADDGFRARAVPLVVAGVPVETLSTSDHLLLVCVHGLRWSSEPACHWVADATMLLRLGIDWQELIAEAVKRELARPLLTALRLLRDELEAEVPATVMAALARHARGVRPRLELWARQRRPSLARGIFLHWCGHARATRDVGWPVRLARFPRYLQELWGVESPWRLPLVAARKSARRLALEDGGR